MPRDDAETRNRRRARIQELHAKGMSQRAIGRELGLNQATVRFYLMEKMIELTPSPNSIISYRPDFRLGDYREVLADVQADLIFTSPPYNIGSKQPRNDGFRSRGMKDPKSFGAIRDYDDSLPESEYQDQQAAFLVWAAEHLMPDGVLVYNHKPRRRNKQMIHPAKWFLRPEVEERLVLMEELIWDRGSTHNHDKTMLWPESERLYVFRRPGDTYPLKNTEEFPRVFRADVWRIPLTTKNNGHNAPFPLPLAEAVVAMWSRPGTLVCDPYSGSGTTAVAAFRLGRQFVGAELLEKYHEGACRRLKGEMKQEVLTA